MTTNLKTSHHHLDYDTENLIAALTDPDYHDAKVRYVGESGSKLLSFDHNAKSGRLIVCCRQRIDRDDLPGIARRFARDPVFADREETWQLSPTWSSAQFTVDVADAPMQSGGRLSLLDNGGGSCTLTARTYITVSAPLMSRSIERAMADNVKDRRRRHQDGRYVDFAQGPSGPNAVDEPPHGCLTLYELDTDDLPGVLESIAAAKPTMTNSKALDGNDVVSYPPEQNGSRRHHQGAPAARIPGRSKPRMTRRRACKN